MEGYEPNSADDLQSLGDDDFPWDLGTYFTDKEAIKDAIRTYVVHIGKNLKNIKNDNRRVKAKCIGGQKK